MLPNSITRREFLRLSALAAGGAVLSACAIGNAALTPSTGATIAPTALPAASASVATATILATARPLALTTLGDARRLPTKILGASAESLIEHLIDDPRKVAAIKQTAPAFVRFPGGSQSNYYNWRDGLLHFDPQPTSSAYYKFWAAAAAKIARAYPQGVHYEEYAAFANQIGGADIVLVPNLETSSVDEQVAWFKQLASEKILTRYIELGNEFWVAMAGDPNVERQWQSEPAAMNVMRQYEQALRPIVGAGAKFAVQASAASFTRMTTNSAFAQRLVQWDRDLAPADWFDAVTAHLYPSPDLISAQAGNPSLQDFFALMMGREDAGIDRVLNDISNQVPGKEIWVTEWNPRGGSPVNINTPAKSKVQPPMNAQLIARTLLAMLRHPQVTQSLYFTLNVSEGTELQSYVQSGDQFLPMAPTVVVGWFDDAANGGATFQRAVETNGQVVSNLGPLNESYRPIEGGWFQSDKRTVLILQNASAQARTYDPTQGAKPKPTRIDLLATPDLENTARIPASIASLDPASPIVLPAYSIARVVWE
jgi:hypothetical protein